jgi:hypothetical protein
VGCPRFAFQEVQFQFQECLRDILRIAGLKTSHFRLVSSKEKPEENRKCVLFGCFVFLSTTAARPNFSS